MQRDLVFPEKLRLEKKKLEDTEKNIKTLLNEADELAMKAEKKNNFFYMRDSNEKRKRAGTFTDDSIRHKAKIQKLEKDLGILEQ